MLATDVLPGVSIIVPVLNEVAHIARCLESLLNQDYPHIIEILVLDGGSEDGTRDVVAGLRKSATRVQLIDNPARVQTMAFNKGLEMAQGEIVVRADAHGIYDERYVSEIVRVLLEVEKAGAAEGPMYVSTKHAKTLVAKAIVIAHCSKFGIGAGKFHDPRAEGWADAGWLGGYWRDLAVKVGGFRPELLRTEDIDFYARLRELGYGLYLSPKIKAHYTPRSTLGGLWRQNFANGMGVIQTLFVNQRAISLRHLVPFVFVISLLGGLILAPISWWGRLWFILTAVPYVMGLVFFSLYDGLSHSLSYVPLMPVVFTAIHMSYGLGSIWGLAKSLYRRICFGDVNIFGIDV